MDRSIRAILDTDRQARALADAAEQRRQNVPQTVEEHRRDLATAYEHGAAEAVSYTEEEQNKRVAEEKAAVNAEQARLLGAMAARVEQMHDAWVQELARRVTEE